MCIKESLSNEVSQFDGFGFCNSLERPNYWQEHAHPEIQITVPQTNAKAWIDIRSPITRQSKKRIEPGQSFIVYSDRPHALEWQQTAELTLVYLHSQFIARVVGESTKKIKLIDVKCDLPVNDTLIYEIGAILALLCSSGLADLEKLYVENLASLLAVHLLKNYSNYEVPVFNPQKRLSPKKLQAVFEYVEENLERKITLVELATVAGIGKYYFCRLFKGSTNTTPYGYVLHRRVERAKRLLKSSNLPICDIALECGFGNQSHLAKHFRKMIGTTPRRYRQSDDFI